MPFVADTTSIEFTQTFVDSTINTSKENHEPTFTIHKSGEFVGLIGFKATDKGNRKTEIGYWLSEPYQGQELNINRVQIKCAVGNTPSSAIPKRLGFIFEGIERAGELGSNDIFYDLEVYSFLLVSDIKLQLNHNHLCDSYLDKL